MDGCNQARVGGREKKAKCSFFNSHPVQELTFVHLFFQLNLKGSCCLLNPRVVKTSLEIPILSFLNLPS
jgi:hypothetical protein